MKNAELMRLAELVGSNGLIVIEDRLTKPTSKLTDDIRVNFPPQLGGIRWGF